MGKKNRQHNKRIKVTNNIKKHAKQIPFSSFVSLYSEFHSYIKDSTIFFRYARQSSKHKTNIMRSVHAPITNCIIPISIYTIN